MTYAMRLSGVLLAAILISIQSPAAADDMPSSTSPSISITDAHRAHYFGDYARALAIYTRLAQEQGDAVAAEHAGFMLLAARSSYARAVRRDEARAAALLLQAARAGRPGAQFMLNMLDQAD